MTDIINFLLTEFSSQGPLAYGHFKK